ncbi:MAG TPA: hypothetical protein VHQ66_16480 [Myxococcota bacterium]|nr:hypothetical protein [Myxococcota bacterium]
MTTHEDSERRSQDVGVQGLGDVIEVTVTETVDGDLNGAPELAGIEESRDWEAADAVDAMEIGAGDLASAASKTEVLERLVAERREVLIARTPEACALGLGALFEAVASATWGSPDAPIAADDDVLRERLAQLETALAQLEGALDAPGERVRPPHGSPAAQQGPSRDESPTTGRRHPVRRPRSARAETGPQRRRESGERRPRGPERRDHRALARHRNRYGPVARHPTASLLVALAVGGALWSRLRARRG